MLYVCPDWRQKWVRTVCVNQVNKIRDTKFGACPVGDIKIDDDVWQDRGAATTATTIPPSLLPLARKDTIYVYVVFILYILYIYIHLYLNKCNNINTWRGQSKLPAMKTPGQPFFPFILDNIRKSVFILLLIVQLLAATAFIISTYIVMKYTFVQV